LRDSTQRAIKLGTFSQHVVAAPAYLKRRGIPKRPEHMAQHDWVALSLLPAPLTKSAASPVLQGGGKSADGAAVLCSRNRV
jgi:hypothetical protein